MKECESGCGQCSHDRLCLTQESMRLLPALTGTNRMAYKDIMLGGYLIPRRTMIWCNLNAMFSSPEVWDEPDKYIPVSCNFPMVLMCTAMAALGHDQAEGACGGLLVRHLHSKIRHVIPEGASLIKGLLFHVQKLCAGLQGKSRGHCIHAGALGNSWC